MSAADIKFTILITVVIVLFVAIFFISQKLRFDGGFLTIIYRLRIGKLVPMLGLVEGEENELMLHVPMTLLFKHRNFMHEKWIKNLYLSVRSKGVEILQLEQQLPFSHEVVDNDCDPPEKKIIECDHTSFNVKGLKKEVKYFVFFTFLERGKRVETFDEIVLLLEQKNT